MTFTLTQTGLTATGVTASGTTTLATVLPALSTAGTLLVATMQTAAGGTPFKCSNLVTAPGNVAAAAVGTGGTFAAGTYFWVVTATTAAGETVKSAEVSATVALNGSASLTWSALPAQVTGVKVYRGTSAGGEDHLIATLGRVTSYTDTGTTGSAASLPQSNTTATPNTSPGWVYCGLAPAGSVLQGEIWAYPNNPGGLSGGSFTNAAGAACRGTIQEWSTTKKWQVMDLFPGASGATGTGQPSATTNGTPGTGDLMIALLTEHYTVNPTGQSWTTPAGWTLVQSQANNLATPWASYYQVATGAGAVTITGNYSTSTNQDAKAAVVVAFREADSVAAGCGVSGINGGTYSDQGSFGYTADLAGSMNEFDHFIGRRMANASAVIFQTVEGASTSSVPGAITTVTNAGCQVHWALKPQRATSGSGTTTEQGKVDNALTVLKQAGITGFVVSFFNEFDLGGKNGPFGNDTFKTGGTDPYGTGNTEATAKANWLAYWANWQPIAAAHGIPAYAKGAMGSATDAVTWMPPAGTVSGVQIDYYSSDGISGGHFLDTSPATGVPSLQDVCDGVKNPDGTAASNAPIPLGLGEWGRAGGSSTTITWAQVVTWSSAHVRGFFKARLSAGKQNAPVCWYENNLGSVNWIHTPGAGGEDQTGIQAEIRQTVDDLTVSAVTGGNPVITTTSPLPSGQVGVPYSASLTASGGTTPYAWAVTTGALPAGLTLDPVTGQITGSPTVAGTLTVGFTVTDAASLTGTASLSVTIAPVTAVTVPPQSLPGGTQGVPYSTALSATGGTPPYTWSVTSGTLPSGLTLAAVTGIISGTPTGTGTSSFTVGVTDAASGTASRALTITVAPGAVAVVTTSLPAATQTSAYNAALAAAGGTPPYTWAVTSGSLPPGLALGTSGTITGVASGAGTYTFTVQATDSLAATASANLTIVVAAITVVVSPGPWRFLLAAPQPDGTYLAEIAQAQNRRLVMRTEPDQMSEVSFDILGDVYPASQVLELETDIHVMWGSQLLYVGRVGATQDTIDSTGHHLNVTAADYREVLRRRAILPGDTISFTGTEQALIAWNLLNASQGRSGGNLGIARGKGQNTGKTRTMTFQTGDYIGDDITQIAQLSGGFEWQISPYAPADLRFDVFYPQQGTSRGVVLTPGDARVASITRATDPSTFANAIYETGQAPSGGSAPTAQFVESGTVSEGRWDKVIGSSITLTTPLNDDANAQLAAAQVLIPAYTIVLKPGTWGGPGEIWIGDMVTVQITSGRLQVNDALRVVEMQFAVDANGLETLTLTVGALILPVHKKIGQILRRLRYLETRL